MGDENKRSEGGLHIEGDELAGEIGVAKDEIDLLLKLGRLIAEKIG